MILYKTKDEIKYIDFGGLYWFATAAMGVGFTTIGYLGYNSEEQQIMPIAFFIIGVITGLLSLFQKAKTIIFSTGQDRITVIDSFPFVPFSKKEEYIYNEQPHKIERTIIITRLSHVRGDYRSNHNTRIILKFKSGGGITLVSSNSNTGGRMIKKLANVLNIDFEDKSS